jgi:hypothetical protein
VTGKNKGNLGKVTLNFNAATASSYVILIHNGYNAVIIYKQKINFDLFANLRMWVVFPGL